MVLKVNYARFPPVCRDLENSGWVASAWPPSPGKIRNLCSEYSIEEPLFASDSKHGDLLSFTLKDSASDALLDFDDLLNKLRAEQREV